VKQLAGALAETAGMRIFSVVVSRQFHSAVISPRWSVSSDHDRRRVDQLRCCSVVWRSHTRHWSSASSDTRFSSRSCLYRFDDVSLTVAENAYRTTRRHCSRWTTPNSQCDGPDHTYRSSWHAYSRRPISFHCKLRHFRRCNPSNNVAQRPWSNFRPLRELQASTRRVAAA